ncbi:uncharacterized protein BX664DRAFT_371565 [Halteromyces radiatus]|uniref:uncharacterized protein n=1 Tax=Halteromyces radiatus TaxID=101107 RepID=UPI00222067DF|nr:uncharacterized protein BX664DRAFT_371565 [Halteromyces radiatus]KAI8092744.1 hypothetical protein BX664DRAFT_371565 [Halteromyces radiatus]
MEMEYSPLPSLPPSPTDPTSPPLRKESSLYINTKQALDQPSLFSPPLSPLTSPDRLLFNNNHAYKKKTSHQQQQQQQTVHNSWQSSWQEVDIETLTLENAKLQRANRLLKVDRENWLEKRIKPLDQHIRDLTMSNVRWQRATRLLQQELQEAKDQLTQWKRSQWQSKIVCTGSSEYQFLVDMIHHLQSQIHKQSTFNEIGENTTMTTECNDILSNKQVDGYLMEKIQQLEQDLAEALKQLKEQENDKLALTSELLKKDELVTQLEKDFMTMSQQLNSLQKIVESHSLKSPVLSNAVAPLPSSEIEEQPTVETADASTTAPTIMEMNLMIKAASRTMKKRRIVSTQQDGTARPAQDDPFCLDDDRGKSTRDDGCQDDVTKFDKSAYDLPTPMITTNTSPIESSVRMDHRRTCSSVYSTTSTTCWDDHDNNRIYSSQCSSLNSLESSSSLDQHLTATPFLPSLIKAIFFTTLSSTTSLPGSFPSKPITKQYDEEKGTMMMLWLFITGNEPFAPCVLLTMVIGLSSNLGIKDDWLIPLTLMVLFSGYLWCGALCGIHVKFNFQDLFTISQYPSLFK